MPPLYAREQMSFPQTVSEMLICSSSSMQFVYFQKGLESSSAEVVYFLFCQPLDTTHFSCSDEMLWLAWLWTKPFISHLSGV